MNKKLAILATFTTICPIIFIIMYVIKSKDPSNAILNVFLYLAIIIVLFFILYILTSGVMLLYYAWLIYFNKKFPK